MEISVITPTVRHEGLPLVAKALSRQTFDSFEWIIVSPQCPERLDYDFRWIIDPLKKEGDYWTIYKAYNEAVRHAKGHLIVSVQDYTYFKPDGLAKFHYYYDCGTVVSGVGNKYSDETFTEMTWKDPRIKGQSFRRCDYNEIEWNYCSIPKSAIYEVGGFDEEMDKYSSLCGLDILDRLRIKGGYKFYLDETNITYSLEHGRLPNWEENLPFQTAYPKRLKEYEKNPVLDYL
jgi:hypothetical protein